MTNHDFLSCLTTVDCSLGGLIIAWQHHAYKQRLHFIYTVQPSIGKFKCARCGHFTKLLIGRRFALHQKIPFLQSLCHAAMAQTAMPIATTRNMSVPLLLLLELSGPGCFLGRVRLLSAHAWPKKFKKSKLILEEGIRRGRLGCAKGSAVENFSLEANGLSSCIIVPGS